MSGRLIGVGTGPGNPELLTLRAVRALGEADVLAHFAKRGNRCNARETVLAHLRPGLVELPLYYPVTTETARTGEEYQSSIADFFDRSAADVAAHLDAGRSVAVLSEGDPMFYGSYMHLHVRLADRYEAEIIPGVTGMSGSWSAAGVPIAQGDDVLSILPGTLDEAELQRRIAGTEACVIMKVGRNLPKIRRAIEAAGRLSEAIYVERATMAAMDIEKLADKADDEAPYFSIVLVPGWSTQP